MQSELSYYALFVLGAAFLILTLWRIVRAANRTIAQLNDESRRDRLQHARIARQKRMQSRSLRRGSRRINGRDAKLRWDGNGRRATRDYHADEAADEVFDPVSDLRGMDIRTPWGWPRPNGRRIPGAHQPGPPLAARLRRAAAHFFKPRQVVDEEVRARRRRAIRALVEDRYGRAGYGAGMAEIEWSRPALPEEYLEERRNDQMAVREGSRRASIDTGGFKALRLVSGARSPRGRRKASGE